MEILVGVYAGAEGGVNEAVFGEGLGIELAADENKRSLLKAGDTVERGEGVALSDAIHEASLSKAARCQA